MAGYSTYYVVFRLRAVVPVPCGWSIRRLVLQAIRENAFRRRGTGLPR
jgi:hypothetical protein